MGPSARLPHRDSLSARLSLAEDSPVWFHLLLPLGCSGLPGDHVFLGKHQPRAGGSVGHREAGAREGTHWATVVPLLPTLKKAPLRQTLLWFSVESKPPRAGTTRTGLGHSPVGCSVAGPEQLWWDRPKRRSSWTQPHLGLTH